MAVDVDIILFLRISGSNLQNLELIHIHLMKNCLNGSLMFGMQESLWLQMFVYIFLWFYLKFLGQGIVLDTPYSVLYANTTLSTATTCGGWNPAHFHGEGGVQCQHPGQHGNQARVEYTGFSHKLPLKGYRSMILPLLILSRCPCIHSSF